MKKIAISLTLLVIFLSIGVFALKGPSIFKKEAAPTREQLILTAIIEGMPQFIHDGKPAIEIYSVSQFEGKWYIVTIKSVRPIKNFVPVRLVLLEEASRFRIIVGPDTYFPEDRLLSLNLPDSVILELQKS